ncbi:MAG: tRNA uridine-5-carboxymethylaminomethyl(34) synthesis GTPase MnmE [Pseudomonadota bacterium]|nr:tRNA uridine-5-carboxymethylaminomethyl(34) synthesis GTPase MnmE [Pseudomonadota bacterium]
MNNDARQTIFAPATGRATGAVAIVRISGPATDAVLADVAGSLPAPRHAALCTLIDPDTNESIDRALVLRFSGPASYTGEDMAEFQIHGGRAVTAALIRVLTARPGCRPAEPGEFTKRAFLNGRLDLAEAEGVMDLVSSETDRQRRQALAQMDGALSRQVEDWRAALIAILALAEAGIDFAGDEPDVDENVSEAARERIGPLADSFARHLAAARGGEILRDGVRIAILGAPNVGKSRLLNTLARRDVAIVSERAGTTRDVVEVHLDLAGIPVILADTAGLCDAECEIEQEGVRRARLTADTADLKLLVFDTTDAKATRAILAEQIDDRALLIANKCDLAAPPEDADVALSAATGEGIDALLAVLGARLDNLLGFEPALLTRVRHRAALTEAAEALERAKTADISELMAEDIRLATAALGRLTGHIDVEQVLDAIFSEFCIGK